MRFLLVLAMFWALVTGLFLIVIFALSPYAAVERLGHIAYFEIIPDGLLRLPLALTPGRYAALRAGAWALLGGGLVGALALLRTAAYRRPQQRLGKEACRVVAALGRTVRRWSGPERAVAGGLLLAIFLVQLLWFVTDPLGPDETASYDDFVYRGAVAVTSFYPIPNNHVFYNFLSWELAHLFPGQVRVIMRLPSLLAATAGTALSYALLAHFRNFRVATVVTALFGLTRLTIIYAASGRGYYVQIVCIQLAFFATMGLVTAHPYRRLAWAVFVGSSILGLYTIPTYAGPLLALGLVLGVAGLGFEPRYRRRFWGQCLLAGAIVGTTAAALYAPVGCVSGWPRLLANRYIVSNSLATFWHQGPAHLYETVNALLGPVRPGLVGTALLLALTPLALLRSGWLGRGQWLAWGCWALLVTPMVLVVVQRVFIPARVLIYATYFLFLLAALGADFVAARWRGRWVGRVPAGLLWALVAFRVVELGTQVPALFQTQREEEAVVRSYRWLRAQPLGAVFLAAPYHQFMFFHYGLLNGHPLALHSQYRAGQRYPYLVWMKALDRPAWATALPYRTVYEDPQIVIYALVVPSAGTPPAGR